MYKLIVLCILSAILFYLIRINSYYGEAFNDRNKIAVCMWYDDAIKDYGDIAKQINNTYCEKNNYDLIYSNKRLLPKRHPAWERFPLLLNTLNMNKYDHIVWIDADACFNSNSDNTIENIINENKDTDIIFSGDVLDDQIINSGFIILKNSNISKQFCKNVIKSNKRPECRKHFNKRSWEQSCIIDLYTHDIDNIKDNSIIIPYKILQIFPHLQMDKIENSLIIHYAEADHEIRLAGLTNIYNNTKII
jgi:hypothetical protein